MPHMKPMIWTIMLASTLITLITLSSIMHFSYTNKMPNLNLPTPPHSHITHKWEWTW